VYVGSRTLRGSAGRLRRHVNLYESLPDELTDRIIDFLHSDEDALSSCSLVCKAWLPSNRYHYSLYISPRNVDYLVELLATPTLTIGKHAHYLEIGKIGHSKGYRRPIPALLGPWYSRLGMKNLPRVFALKDRTRL
jgi:hypothetical protein